ncbi:inositol monophosphatase [Thalassococcus sp. CAU 1522]|uniref:Inositol monophosphatase n=1 Tax=Thalassococcus arenae TaxID=2851652 RepID=A0ABS6N5J7_9RHOB|nr:inositol monophosphatase [Thalassococcus arenae]MBV2359290.1 inositol monophosphatase [Thalassococcus arenae]
MTDQLPMPVTALTRAQRNAVMNLVRRAARAEIMPRFRNLGAHQIDQKSGPQDLVTEADRAAEAMIARGLQAMFPHALIVGEEHATDHPEILDRIAEAELCFTIDPVDGTWNYAHGLPLFGVMLSILRFGLPVFGLLFDPVVGDMIWADTDTTAQLQNARRLSRPVRASAGGPVEKLVGSVPLYLVPADKQAQTAATLPRFARAVMLRCACHEYRMLAQGQLDFVLFAKMTAWDHPAGALIAKQAGGHVAMLDGSDYRGDVKSGYLLAASDAATWGRVRDVFDFLL